MTACAIGKDKSVSCWGSNRSSQIGQPYSYDTDTSRETGVLKFASAQGIPGFSPAVGLAIHNFACAYDGATTIHCVGGWPPETFYKESPDVQSVALPGRATKIVSGENRLLVLLDDHTVMCQGTYCGSAKPEVHAPSDKAAAKDMDLDYAEAVAGAGATLFSTLQQVPGLTDVIDIASGNEHSCVAFRAGGVRCWGTNRLGAAFGLQKGAELTDLWSLSKEIGEACEEDRASCTSKYVGVEYTFRDFVTGSDGTRVELRGGFASCASAKNAGGAVLRSVATVRGKIASIGATSGGQNAFGDVPGAFAALSLAQCEVVKD